MLGHWRITGAIVITGAACVIARVAGVVPKMVIKVSPLDFLVAQGRRIPTYVYVVTEAIKLGAIPYEDPQVFKDVSGQWRARVHCDTDIHRGMRQRCGKIYKDPEPTWAIRCIITISVSCKNRNKPISRICSQEPNEPISCIRSLKQTDIVSAIVIAFFSCLASAVDAINFDPLRHK
ncbi:hypothetical protein D8674_002614 [Pyrus ussuriensis x Pyrus communis]|uniref:Uncharacterized protein n=1 Tax=Pyrus ussuriensis x Pyrus communis TaxID=2448454 RepID=A0A5N5FET3_9ROSA|nr:hypothetical protein D8674_002614 [Pyrus ussuriensis x Pyrus communis]